MQIAGLMCVQSLYSTWKEEKVVLRRLQALNMVCMDIGIEIYTYFKNVVLTAQHVYLFPFSLLSQ
jgi:hypothetical protein